MARVFTIGARGAGLSAVSPKRGTTPRPTPVQQVDRDDDIDDDMRDRAPPPPGMGKLVDRLA